MWIESYEFADANRMKHYAKRHRREYVSCLANLADVIAALNNGAAVTAIPFRFFRSEHEDVYRIGQTNVKHPHETRLYVYACVIQTTIYVLTVGDKSTQRLDINACHAKARELKAQLASEPQADEEKENG
jgi:hypothetical protein